MLAFNPHARSKAHKYLRRCLSYSPRHATLAGSILRARSVVLARHDLSAASSEGGCTSSQHVAPFQGWTLPYMTEYISTVHKSRSCVTSGHDCPGHECQMHMECGLCQLLTPCTLRCGKSQALAKEQSE